MAENPNQKQIDKIKKQFAKNSGEKKGDPKKPKNPLFSFYWIYVLIFALFIGMQIFSAMSFSAKSSNYQEFEQALELGEVDRVKIINEKKIQVFIKEDALRDSEKYSEVRNSNLSDELNSGP